MQSKRKRAAGLLRYVFLYILVITIPFSVVIGIFSAHFFAEYKAAVVESSRGALLSVKNSFELIFNQMEYIVEQLGRDQELLKYDLQENLHVTMRLKKILSGYKVSNECFDSLMMYRRGNELLCAYDSTYNLSNYCTTVNRMDGVSPDEFETIINTCDEMTIIGPQFEELLGTSGDEYISFVYPISIPGGTPKGTLLIRFKVRELENYLDLKTPGSNFIVAIPAQGRTVILSGNHRSDEYMMSYIENTELETVGMQTIRLEGEGKIITYCKNEDTGVIYLCAASEKAVMGNVVKQQKTFFAMVFILSAMEILGVLLVGYRRYKSLETLGQYIEESFPRLNSGNVGRWNNVVQAPESARRIIQTMQSNQENLSRELRQKEDTLQDMILYKLISGGFTSEARALEGIRQANILLDQEYVVAAVLSGTMDEAKKDVWMEQLGNHLGTAQAYMFHLTATRYAVIFSVSEESLESRAEALLSFIGTFDGLRFGVGNATEQRERLFVSFSQALRALDYAIKKDVPTVLYEESLAKEQSFFSDYPADKVQRFGRSIAEDNLKWFRETLEEIVAIINAHKGEYLYIRTLVYDCASVILQALRNNGKHMEETEVLSMIMQANSSAEMLDVFDEVCKQAGEYFEGLNEARGNQFIERAVAAMHENIESYDFSMAALAAQMGTTQSNLSQQFKKYMNQTPMEYLNTLKVERAKYYLRNTNMTGKMIMERLGYASEASFVRMFKSRCGVTPGNYRKGIETEEQE